MSTHATRFLQEETARLQKENKALQEQVEILNRYIGTLVDLYWSAKEIPEEEDLMGLLDDRLYDIIDIVGAKDGSLLTLDGDTDELVFTIVHGELSRQLPGHTIKSDSGVAGWVVQNNEMVIVNNPRQDWRFSLAVDEEFSFLTRSILAAPILLNDEVVGIIEFINKDPDGFTETDAAVVNILSNFAATVLEELESRSEATMDFQDDLLI